MATDKSVSVRIRKDTKAGIESRREHPRETLDDVLRRLLAADTKRREVRRAS